MHPLLTDELACFHEREVRREVAAARGPGGRRARRFGAAAGLAVLITLLLVSSAFAAEQHLSIDGTDMFGLSVAVDGNTLAIGAPADAKGQGAVYVFERSGDDWRQTGKLTASDGKTGDVLGISVGISGDTVVAGAPGHSVDKNPDAGAAYVFARTGAPTRTETKELTSASGEGGVKFGSAVAIDGDVIAVGAPLADANMSPDRGAVFTFTAAGAPSGELSASDGSAKDEFGASVAVDGDTIVAGAPVHSIVTDKHEGEAYAFASTGPDQRQETARLVPKLSGDDANAGRSVAIDGDTIVVGAPQSTVATSNKGAVFTFPRSGPAVREATAKLTASDGHTDDILGQAVAIDGDTITAGAPGAKVGDNAQPGAVYTFARSGLVTRRETGKTSDGDGPERDLFGVAVATAGDTTVVGSGGRSAASG